MMKTPSVKLQPSQRRLWPYLLIVSMCGLIAWVLLENVQPSTSADSTAVVREAPAIAPSVSASPGHSAAALEVKECACSQCSKPDPTIAEVVNKVQRANSPVVENLLKKFRQGDRAITPSSFENLKTHTIGKHVTLTAAGIEWHGILDSRIDGPEVFHFGITLDEQLGRFQISLREDQRMNSAILFNGENLALVANGLPEDGSWKFETSTYDQVVCAPAGALYTSLSDTSSGLKAPTSLAGAQPGPLSALPLLSSKPKSTFVLYMDFDGEVVTHPGWNNGKTIDAKPDPRAENATYVTNVWKRVAEDFAPFDLNVTTDRAVFDAAAVSRRVMCVSTPTNTAAPGAGGVAYLRSFGQDTPCWNFNISSEYASADTVSHEVGHTLGLSHDGTDKEAYYGGHGGTGPFSWSPIMGAAWANANYEEVTQFSKGEYPKANNQEDDLSMITQNNGFGYEPDDKGNSQATASYLKTVDGKVEDSGIIERSNDVDWLSFITSGGIVQLDFKVLNVNSSEAKQRGANLALSAELYDSDGKLIQGSNGPDQPDATISSSLAAGTYFVKVDGVARGTLATGFPEYGSLGQYWISGTIPQSGLISLTPPTSNFTPRIGSGTFNVTSTFQWTWSCSETWVTSNETATQQGNQQFNFSVAANPAEERTAVIYVSVGGYTVSHTITQAGVGTDDHSNFIVGATPVNQNSITDGIIEIEGDLDVFLIRCTQFGDLTFESSGFTNTFGELLDYNGTVLASNDNALQPNFRITRQVNPGTYYVRVRHAITRGTGAYKMVVKFNSKESLSINPLSRNVTSAAAAYAFSIVCNTAWTWSSDVPWLTSSEATSQIFGQRFDYAVSANNTSSSRTGRLTLTAGQLTVVHTVVQIGSLTDDHGDTMELATTIQPTSSHAAKIETVGDLDVFRVVLTSAGELKAWSTGTTDTYGYLLDSTGAEVARNDDLAGINFGFTYKVNAGTYYVKVKHFSANGTGNYGLDTNFIPAKFVSATYTASFGGSLSGIALQTVTMGGNASPVTALPNTGFAFIRWSDGRVLPARDDRHLTNHMSVTAEFAPMLSVAILGGEMLRDNQYPKVNYGTRWINEIVPMSFQISNNGTTPVTGLTVVKSGIHVSQWSLSTLELTTLQPGQSTTFTATLQGTSAGYKNAIFTVSGTGTGIRPFRIPVMTNILNNLVVEGVHSATTQDLSVMENPVPIRQAMPAILAAPPAPAPDTAVIVSPDGWLRHQFLLANNRALIPDFFISHDGIHWVLAEQISVRKTDQLANWDQYEVILSPMGIHTPVIFVSEIPPMPGQP